MVVRSLMKSRYFSPSLILSPLGREDEGEGMLQAINVNNFY
jgi:hypothetical protein